MKKPAPKKKKLKQGASLIMTPVSAYDVLKDLVKMEPPLNKRSKKARPRKAAKKTQRSKPRVKKRRGS